MAALFLISTPIGNRKDITLRALETLFSVDILLCEDTRNTAQLLNLYRKDLPEDGSVWLNIHTSNYPKLVSLFEHNEESRIAEVIAYLQEGKNLGLVSNAGTPTISDPGFRLVNACLQAGFQVIPIPGVSALVAALSVSGLSADKFTFLSFLPRKTGKQTQIWEDLKTSQLKQTVIFYESPFRIQKTLATMDSVFGDIPITIARELTKVHESIETLAISQWQSKLTKPLKGEVVVLFRLGKE